MQIDPAVNLEELSRVAHSLGEVVGLGLRNLANCPVEMNLMPESTLRWQSFNQKKPYLIASVFSLVLVLFAIGFLFQKLAANKEAEAANLDPKVQELNNKSTNFKSAYGKLQKAQKEADQITTWMQQRYYWGDFLADMRRALLRSEDSIKKKLSAQKPNVEAGIWIETLTADSNLGGMSAAAGGAPPPMPMPGGFPERIPMRPGDMPQPPMEATPQAGAVAGQANTNTITMICRAVSLTSVDPAANSAIAYAVESEIKNSPFVDPKATSLVGNIVPDDVTGTFTFTVNVAPTNLPSF